MNTVYTWQAGFLALLPAVQTHAKIQFRHLPPCRREDAIQEAIASACVSYQMLAAKGRLHVAHPGTIATFAVNFVRNGRHVGGHQDAAKDVLSSVAQRRHGFACRSANWQQMAIAERRDPIPDTAAFRIDFAAWLKTLTRPDRRIIAAFVRARERGKLPTGSASPPRGCRNCGGAMSGNGERSKLRRRDVRCGLFSNRRIHMGYTIYWQRPAQLPADRFAAAVEDFRQMLPLLDVPLAGPHGKGSAILGPERIAFNGQSPQCCESFDFRREELDRRGDGIVRSFCKTNRLPYDLAVKAALLILRRHLGDQLVVSSDGGEEEWDEARRIVAGASLPKAVADYLDSVMGQIMVEDCVWFRWNIAQQKIESAGNLLPSEWPKPIEEIPGTILFVKTTTGWAREGNSIP